MDRKQLSKLRALKIELTRFMMLYQFALDELNTKFNILKQEFEYIHDYNPIENVTSRVKSPESILKKVHKKGFELSLPSIRENIQDIAGVRITCSFISDIYELKKQIEGQQDLEVVEIKDYIANPKPNGYQSLHLILRVPVSMSDRIERVFVEVQIRTIAMDFWASLEHKIYYKYNQEVPKHLVAELKEAAHSAAQLDKKMESIHMEMNEHKEALERKEEVQELVINNEKFRLPLDFLTTTLQMKE
ncbi:GTP pyrophosphokinase [Halalkalibacter wakoensis JCM 9140]|uniref:GTP pyrophosphokinase n=1 Tax=Halalkalibacter wakoensis JCM 9140 TaxID=1236970 RepID=W4Q4J9_9BACI|nr:GTP pyrophosphokinase family protein [Halalkalibacter wakoensis]GAE26294.1 GTP pyrophosphokinase [Halalkalibacter wakoensis JCM 9140]